MPPHPELHAFLAERQVEPDLSSIAAFREGFAIPRPAVACRSPVAIAERSIGALSARVYRPEGPGPFPVTLYFHGGGFVVGSPRTTDGICLALAEVARSLIVSVDYRLAPEARFPAAVEDASDALRWLATNAAELAGDPSKIAVAGDSSGGNLAAVVAQQARSALCHQLLIYPVLDAGCSTDSYRDHATGYLLTAKMMRWFWAQYLANASDADDVRASPLRAVDVSDVPSATIITAELDVLRDEAVIYANRLRAADVHVDLQEWPGQIHGFCLLQGLVGDADRALAAGGGALADAFARA